MAPTSIPNMLFLSFLTVSEYTPLERIMKGIRYTRKIVTLPKSIPLMYAIDEGNIRKGIVFLKPNLRVEYINMVFTTIPTRYWGLPMSNGTRSSIEKRMEYSISF